ncbi:nucleotidyltransferase domain-containing protein [Alcanivorax jadensis]|uniref:nucleotidyltransferase domain-containing protein n=1 Tax=Alcanivorax jadensis TaxID=64988 RepID=UPI0024090397|nr:nucleotidyltransferase domain-containing protein [Alcanivorax jadensis]MDF1637862.1 nucleotidyltransferase domain-containing protein [Alcanivorax jadensis]
MRLNQYQRQEICQAVRELAGAQAHARLFGSRLNDQARGGDIDLLVEVPGEVGNEVELTSRLAGCISHRLGGPKVDVLIAAKNSRLAPVHQASQCNGVIL